MAQDAQVDKGLRGTALALGVTVMLSASLGAASMALGADGKPFLIGKQTRPGR